MINILWFKYYDLTGQMVKKVLFIINNFIYIVILINNTILYRCVCAILYNICFLWTAGGRVTRVSVADDPISNICNSGKDTIRITL